MVNVIRKPPYYYDLALSDLQFFGMTMLEQFFPKSYDNERYYYEPAGEMWRAMLYELWPVCGSSVLDIDVKHTIAHVCLTEQVKNQEDAHGVVVRRGDVRLVIATVPYLTDAERYREYLQERKATATSLYRSNPFQIHRLDMQRSRSERGFSDCLMVGSTSRTDAETLLTLLKMAL